MSKLTECTVKFGEKAQKKKNIYFQRAYKYLFSYFPFNALNAPND